MNAINFLDHISNFVLFAVCLFVLAGSIFITIKTRFIQVRFFAHLYAMIKGSLAQRTKGSKHSLQPHRALFTAMSTTLGISTIVSPIIAIHLGGPGALLGYLLTSFFGSAATYLEVNLSIQHRKRLASGVIMGGPMQYLRHLLSPKAAAWYAICCCTLMVVWSGAQANQLAAVLDSPLLGSYRIPPLVSGTAIALLIILTLIRGVKWIGAFSAKLVPLMFTLYLGSCFWIFFSNVDQLPTIFGMIFHSMLSPYPLATGVVVGGTVSALRWGVFKGIQTSEAGIGTQTFPHSKAETEDPETQGALAMLSTYAAGCVAFISGCVALMTGTWNDPSLPLGISMVAASFQHYFSYAGIAIVAISTFLFGFGTILGNSFNGSQCFEYLTENKRTPIYLLGIALMIILGAIAEVRIVWSLVDFVLAAMVIPHVWALVRYAYSPQKWVKKTHDG